MKITEYYQDVTKDYIEYAFKKDIQLGMIRSTYQQTGMSRPSLNKAPDYDPVHPDADWNGKGLPDTWDYIGLNTAQNNFVLLTEPLQWFWYNECVKLDPGHANNASDNYYYYRQFNSATKDDRWTTNRYGSTTCAVYPTGTNLDKEAMRYFTITTGRAIIELAGSPRLAQNRLSYPFKVIDAHGSLAGITFEKFPNKFYRPMNSVRTPILNSLGKWFGGVPSYQENGYGRFGQFNNSLITPLLMPGTDIAFLDVAYVDLLDPRKPIPPIFNM